MKINRIFVFLMIIVLTLGLISCSEKIPDKTEEINTAQNIPNAIGSELKHNIMLSATTYDNDVSTEFGSAVDHGLETTFEYKVFEDIVKKTRTDPFNPQREIVYEKSDCSYLKGVSGEYGTFYSIYDIYKAGSSQYYYLHGTDLLCKYFVYGGEEGVSIENMPTTRDEAKEITDEFLDSIYGEGFSSQYQIHGIVNDSEYFLYKVVYVRKIIEGYTTDDTIAVYIDDDGKIDAINAPNIGKYDYLVDQLSKEKVDAARDIVLAKLQSFDIEGFQVVGMGITTDRVGNLYLKLRYSHTVEYSATPHEELVYISIN